MRRIFNPAITRTVPPRGAGRPSFGTALAGLLVLTAAPALAQDNVVGPPASLAPPPIQSTTPQAQPTPAPTPPPQAQPAPVLPPPVVPTTDDDRPTVTAPPVQRTQPAAPRASTPAAAQQAAPAAAPAREPEPAEAEAPAEAAPAANTTTAADPAAPAGNDSAPEPGFSEPATGNAAAPADDEQLYSEPDQLQRGGWGVWPYVIIALVVAGLALILTRMMSRRRRKRDADVWDEPVAVEPAAPAAASPALAAEPPAPEPVISEPAAAEAPLTDADVPPPPATTEGPVTDPVAMAEATAAPIDAGEAATVEPSAEVEVVEPASEDVDMLAAAAVPSEDRPWLEFALRPVRAGTNVVDAVVEFELTIGNAGGVAANDVRVAAWLLTASPTQDEDIARFLSAPPAEAVMEPFTIEPGDGKRVDAAIALPKTGLNVVTARERPFFVPIVVADARYSLPGGGEGRTSAAFVVGTTKPGAEKLGPIWLDRGPRMHEEVEARLHGDPRRA